VINRRRFLQSSLLAMAASPFVTLSGCARSLSAEFVIVGSGPAGIALADDLASRGHQVLVLEGGTRETSGARQAMHDVEPGESGLPYNIGWATQRLLGGTSNLWQSHSPRPVAAELTSYSQRGFAQDWPLTLEQLTPWLEKAEQWLHVRPARPELNPAMPVNPFIESSAALRELLSGKGYQHLEAGAYGMVGQQGRDALRLLEDGEIDRVAAMKAVVLHPGTAVRQIRMDGARAAELVCAREDGSELRVQAGTVILCGGGIQTPRLLWNSGGVGNHSDWLGAGFMEHPGIQLYGERTEPLLPEGAEETHIHVRDMLYREDTAGLGGTLLHVGLKPGGPDREYTVVEILFEQAPDRVNRILPGKQVDALGDPLPRLDYRLTELDKRGYLHGRALQEALAEAVGQPRQLSKPRPGSHHLMGGTRMSLDPADGVLDTDLRVWGTDNLYVAGSSAFPTGTTVPPTLILVALARRLAARLSDNT
jgi:choline dehydrogenase-like flavoprotein